MKAAKLFLALSLFTAAVHAQPVWTTDVEAAAFLTNVSATGPAVPPRATFSTNWLSARTERPLGANGAVSFRFRGSLEPVTIDEAGYPQLFQVVTRESGGPLVDRMRAQRFISEAAVRVTWSGLHLELAPAGDPPLGAAPYTLRSSAREFAEAPFAYDVQESFHDATRVLSAGYALDKFAVEGGVFHQSIGSGRPNRIDDGPIDSWSARVTVTPIPSLALQVSQGSLGDAKRKLSSASVTYGGTLAASAIWTRREMLDGETLSSVAAELAYRGSRLSLMARVEATDRPVFAFGNRRTDVTLGAIIDVLRTGTLRTGIGANLDYHTATHDLRDTYGHKPQSIYLFLRVRKD
jgi:hypothetical protein